MARRRGAVESVGVTAMRVLVTGHDGYIGTVLVPMLTAAGHEVAGLDSFLFEACAFSNPPPLIPATRRDIRDVVAADLAGFHAVIHLAGLSNDPLGDLNPALTDDINRGASVRLARMAKEAGVRRFLFSSSCSNYGAAGSTLVGEDSAFNPVTPYARAKVQAEREIAPLADETFTPVFLRNATVYGVSPRLRFDLVVNNLVAWACATGCVRLKSDGSAWRPLIHVEDLARAFTCTLEAPRETVHGQAFNVGLGDENFRIRDVADIITDVIPNVRVEFAHGGGADRRSYRVDFSKLERTFTDFKPRWNLRRGIGQIYRSFRKANLTPETFEGPVYSRLEHLKNLQGSGKLDQTLRWLTPDVRQTKRA